MQDESLIDEMRKTLRADRERALGRRREWPAPAAGPGPAPAPVAERTRPGLLARLARLQRRG